MTQAALLVDCYNCEQPLAKKCAECEHAQKKEIRENAQKIRHVSEDPMASKIWNRWIHGELQAPI
jgi:hypothetical protein